MEVMETGVVIGVFASLSLLASYLNSHPPSTQHNELNNKVISLLPSNLYIFTFCTVFLFFFFFSFFFFFEEEEIEVQFIFFSLLIEPFIHSFCSINSVSTLNVKFQFRHFGIVELKIIEDYFEFLLAYFEIFFSSLVHYLVFVINSCFFEVQYLL